MDVVRVVYEGNSVGALSFDDTIGYGAFQYTPEFIKAGVELSPLYMPLNEQIYSFPNLNYETFKGLPGLMADSLPDDFGNRVLNAWVASHGRQPSSITPLERLKYIGTRGMGALEYLPAESI